MVVEIYDSVLLFRIMYLLSNLMFENENVVKLISLKNLVVNRESLFEAYIDCFYKNACSKTSGPINVFEITNEVGKYQLYDGYHRLIAFLINQKHRKDNGEILVKINNSYSIKEYWSVTPENERWFYVSNKKYGNLENFSNKKNIDDNIKRLPQILFARISI